MGEVAQRCKEHEASLKASYEARMASVPTPQGLAMMACADPSEGSPHKKTKLDTPA